MTENSSIQKLRNFYNIKPDAPIYQKEFGFYSMDRWKKEGHVKDGDNLDVLFGFDPPAKYTLGNLGGTTPAFCPAFEVKVLEDQGDYELVQDFAGRKVKYFKGRRNGFMPEYMDHPVKDEKTWEELCLWRLDPKSPERLPAIKNDIEKAKAAAAEGQIIGSYLVGGYMYLRSLIGPVDLLYAFYDNPGLIHRCMRAWQDLAGEVLTIIQKELNIDEILFDEDICYNHGSLISEDMIREFLFPYYSHVLNGVRARQPEKGRVLHFQLATDGFSDAVIPFYKELGMDYLGPFEVASGCDVVRTAKEYPDLLITGGFDKRILARGKDAIDREVDRIMPVMKKRGGYIPTCDHGVPEEVNFEDYLHYRQRMKEFA